MNILNVFHIFFSYFYSTLPVRKVQGLGGKFGEKICDDLGIKFMGDLIRFSKEELQRRYDERSGQWLYNIARGIDLEAVTPRLVSKSIGCCKKFPGRNAIAAITTLNHWLNELANEIIERLEQDELENNRRPKQMVVSYVQSINEKDISSSRTVNITSIDVEKVVADALDVLKKNTDKFFKSSDCTVLNNPIKFLGFNVGKFESTDAKKSNTIQNMFQRTIENQKNEATEKPETVTSSKDGEKSENEVSVNQSDVRKTNTIQNMFQRTMENQKNEIKIEATEEPETATSSNDDETSENEVTVNPNDESEKIDDKKDEEKKSFFLNYHRMRKQAEADRALKEEQEKAEQQKNESAADENDESGDENTFQNDMLMEELEQNNQSVQQPRRSNSPTPSTSKESDFTESYAEFYKPPAAFEIPKVECTQCGKKVNAHDIQVHTDEHLAFQLTQEQREEYRSQLKRTTTSTTTTTPAAKKQKTSTNTKTKTPPKTASIQKFLVKPGQDVSTAVPSTSTANDVETEKCAECGKNIPITELFEHMDYHAAKKLQDELMRSESIANRVNNNTISKNVSQNKSKKSKKSTSASSAGNSTVKNIASFFQNP